MHVINQQKPKHTKSPAMTQFTIGKLSIPFCAGRVNMIYKSVINPGASIVAHAILPGMLKRDSVDVLPIG